MLEGHAARAGPQIPGKGNAVEGYEDFEECLDGPQDCEGQVFARAALSGSGCAYVRCERHFEEYLARVGPRMAELRHRYPDSATPPSWFDPTYAGEVWDLD